MTPPELAGDATDPESTAYWLERANAESRANVDASAATLPAAGATGSADDGFQLGEQIGRGGMGVVLKATQTAFGREVALKRAVSEDPALVAQFLCEARVTGLLEHANIVPVHLLRTPRAGPPELVMKLVRGPSWRDLLHGESAPSHDLEAHLRVLLSVCNALSYTHGQGIIHRDLKPENVMTDDFGQVYVVDWGIAVGLSAEQCAARGMGHAGDSRSPAGTPGYMAPELASGDGPSQGPATDVYLLGSCLHEVLVRRRRHEGATVREVLERAVASEPVVYDASIPRELAEICNTATAARPADRYPDVVSFRRAIESFLKHREAHAIGQKGIALIAEMRQAIARFNARASAADSNAASEAHAAAPSSGGGVWGRVPDSPAAPDDDELAREIHVRFGEAQFALRHALDIWDGLHEAKGGLREARRLMLGHALGTEDATLAARLAEEPEEKAKVAELRAALAARARELDTLRSAARRLDWKATSKPLGWLYIAAGIVGCAVSVVTKEVLGRHLPNALFINAGVWLVSATGLGIAAFLLLRRAHVPDSLVSPRLIGTWGAIAAACLAVGAFNQFRPVLLAHDMSYAALLVAVGFTSMAFQTRRWLLWPAAAFFVGAVAGTLMPDRGFDIVGVLWLVALGGVGIALRRGATLDEGS